MATKVVVCPECSQLVAYGRLSCPSCGALLASVEGSEREERPAVVPGLTEPPRLLPDDGVAPPAPRVIAPPDEGPAPAMSWADEGPFQPNVRDALPDDGLWPSSVRRSGSAMTPSATLGRSSRGKPKPGQASLLADLPFDAPDSLGGWLVALGAGLGLVGFLLPWADRLMEAGPPTGYFASWGLAGPGHGFAFVALLLTLALAILPTPVPAWIRDRALAPILAGVLLGLAWPYLLGPIQPQIGVIAVAAAAVAIACGSVLVQRSSSGGDGRP